MTLLMSLNPVIDAKVRTYDNSEIGTFLVVKVKLFYTICINILFPTSE